MAGANKHVLMAALTYNLKKYLRYTRRISQTSITAIQKANKKKWVNVSLGLISLI
jgi:hypothetical protein